MAKNWSQDWSYYQIGLTDAQYDLLYEHGLCGAIIKGGQNNWKDTAANKHRLAMEARGLPIMIYHWPDPIYAVAPQVQNIYELIQLHSPKAIAIDIEQWWSDWNAYFKAIRGEIRWDQVPRFSSSYLNNFFGQLSAGVRDVLQDFPEVKLIAYSAKYMQTYYVTNLAQILNAYYDGYWHRQGVIDFDPNNDGIITWSELHDAVAGVVDLEPVLPNDLEVPLVMWQLGAPIIRGMPALDQNYVYPLGMEMFGYVEEEEPEEPPVPIDVEIVPLKLVRIANVSSYVNVRSMAGFDANGNPIGADIGNLLLNSVVPVTAIKGDWYKVEGWIWKNATVDEA